MRVILDGSTGINCMMLQAPFFCKSTKLIGATIPITYFNINQSNNIFSVNGTANYVIPIGQYNIIQLISKLNSLLSGIAVVTYNKQTLRVSIKPTVVPTDYRQFIFNAQSASTILGFTAMPLDAYPACIITGSKLADLTNSIRSLYLRTNLQTNDLMINQTYQTGIFRIPVSSARFGDMVDYNNFTDAEISFTLDSMVKYISFEIIDSNFKSVDFNGASYQLEMFFNTTDDKQCILRDMLPSRMGENKPTEEDPAR